MIDTVRSLNRPHICNSIIATVVLTALRNREAYRLNKFSFFIISFFFKRSIENMEDFSFLKNSRLPSINFRTFLKVFPNDWKKTESGEGIEEEVYHDKTKTSSRKEEQETTVKDKKEANFGEKKIGLFLDHFRLGIMRTWVRLGVFVLGLLFCLFGTITTVLWPNIYQSLVNSQLQLTKSSRSFEIWRDTPVPMTMKVYLFNWTNPDKLKIKEQKPKFVEMGPYTFDEYHEKVAIKFHENHTVTFKQIRKWKFDPKRSKGSLSDMVTTLNVPPLTAAYVTRFWGFFVQTSLSYVLGRFEKMTVNKNVSQLLFDGYTDPLISLADTLPVLAGVNIPFDKFGWFYTRNGSDTYDGIFNMDTGSDDIGKLGTLREWNHLRKTNYYEGHCGDIVGSAGELWPPHRSKDKLSMFSSDLCRSIDLPFVEETEVFGIPAFRYEGGVGLVDNGTHDKSNECYCGGQCMPVGVANASSCRYGSPAFVSYPHFLNADPYYASMIEGMDPHADKHSFYITVEPNTGIPLDVSARLQINILMQPSNHIGMYQKVPTVLFPMIWFEETAKMTPEMAASLYMLLNLSDWGVYVCISMIVIGVILVAAVAVNAAISKFSPKSLSGKNKGESISQNQSAKTFDLSSPLMPLQTAETHLTKNPPKKAPYAEAEDIDSDDETTITIAINNGLQNGVYPQLS